MSDRGGKLAGKVALITGAAQGQGRAHAVRFAEEGASLILLDRCEQDPLIAYPMGTSEGLAETARLVAAAGGPAITRAVDIRDAAGLAAAVADGVSEFGRLDVVIANAGVCSAQGWEDVTSEIWELTLATNLTGTWNTCAASIPHLRASGGGSIVLISSGAGVSGTPFLLPYVVSKHGMVGLMRGLANELGQHGIRVNSVHPGGVDTPMGEGAHSQIGPLVAANPDLAGIFAVSLPFGRMAAEDITPSVLYLACDDSRFVTGTTLVVDAGSVNR
jgi:SDR family mycofactocin-dependent oxidoreductase